MPSRRLPPPPPLLWSTFAPETHEHLVRLWTDLLQRQLPEQRRRREGGGGGGHECRHLAQGPTLPFAVTGDHLHSAVDATAGPDQSGEHPTPIPAYRAGT